MYNDSYEEDFTFSRIQAQPRGSVKVVPPTQEYLAQRERLAMEQLDRIELMRQEREAYEERERRILAALPEHDEFDNGVILLIEKRYIAGAVPDRLYSYVALKVADRWFITGTRRVHSGQSYSWLRDFVAFEAEDAPRVWIVTQIEELTS
jgi:hypothetical protein